MDYEREMVVDFVMTLIFILQLFLEENGPVCDKEERRSNKCRGDAV